MKNPLLVILQDEFEKLHHGNAASPHVDTMLAAIAEVNYDSDSKLLTWTNIGDMISLLQKAQKQFS